MGESCLLCGGEVRIVFSTHRARRGFYPQLTIDHDGEPHKCGFILDRIMECVCGEVVVVRPVVQLVVQPVVRPVALASRRRHMMLSKR